LQAPSADLGRAQALLREGRIDEARSILARCVEAEPDNAQACVLLARTLTRKRRFADAAEYFERAHRLHPEDVPTLFELASCLHNQARYEQALERWRELSVLGAKDAQLNQRTDWLELWASAASELELVPEAISVYQRLVALEPGNPDLRRRLAREYLAASRFEEAAKELRICTQAEPEEHSGQYLLGWACLQIGADEEAEKALEKAVALSPSDPECWLKLAKLYGRQDREEEAEKTYARVLELKPSAHEAWHGLARLARMRGDDQRAEECERSFNEHRGESERRTGELRALHHRVAANPSDLDAYREAIEMLLDHGDLEQAEKWVLRLLAAEPDNKFGLMRLSQLMAQNGRRAEALLELEKLLEKEPANAEANLLTGMLHCAEQRWQLALKPLQVSLAGTQDAEEIARIHSLLSTCYRALGNSKAASEHEQAARASAK
jgi:predicted Zn-dependent protease